MRARTKRLFKRLFKTGGLFIFIGLGVMIGFAIGVESAESRQTVIIRSDYSHQLEDDLAFSIEQQINERLDQQIVEQIVIPPIPPIPELPDIPNVPTTIHIENSPSFLDVVNGIGTIFASLGLIGLGAVMLLRNRRQLKEKSPESLNE